MKQMSNKLHLWDFPAQSLPATDKRKSCFKNARASVGDKNAITYNNIFKVQPAVLILLVKGIGWKTKQAMLGKQQRPSLS